MIRLAVAEKSFVVTGASSGIGRAITLHLAQRGCRVFAGVRTEEDEKALQAASERIVVSRLDVTDPEQVAAMVELVRGAVGGGQLHGLVNNAGIAVGGPMEYVELDAIRRQFEVNVFGLLSVTQGFVPLLREAKGRIVNVGSIGGRITTPFVGPYCASKYAVESISDALRMELSPWGIRVAIVEPGPVKTAIWNKAEEELARHREGLPPEALELYAKSIATVAGNIARNRRTAVGTSATNRAIMHALFSRWPKTRYLVGAPARAGAVLRWLLPDRVLDTLARSF